MKADVTAWADTVYPLSSIPTPKALVAMRGHSVNLALLDPSHYYAVLLTRVTYAPAVTPPSLASITAPPAARVKRSTLAISNAAGEGGRSSLIRSGGLLQRIKLLEGRCTCMCDHVLSSTPLHQHPHIVPKMN